MTTDDWEPSMQARLGEVIAGRYRLDSLLGRGGMGCVYNAEHVTLNEPLVVKLIDPVFALDPLARARFRLEAKALMRLRHPGVVTLHDFGEHEGGLFIAMELLVGQTLFQATSPVGQRIPIPRVLEIVRQLALVLEATHAAGIIHRDLKPENIMLLRESEGAEATRVKLMDFGLAHLHESEDARLSATGVVLGTPSYMSPEQCFGRGLSEASDIYSLGVVLFEMLSGRRPFDDPTPAVVMSQHMFVPPPRLETLSSRPGIPAGMATLVEEMLAKKPEVRPSASELLRRLEAIRGGTDAVSFGASSSERRIAESSKSREERALPRATPPADGRLASVEPTMLAEQANGVRPRVSLLGFTAPRASLLESSLAVNGIDVARDDGEATQAKAVLVAGDSGPEALEALRAHGEAAGGGRALPALVVDVAQSTVIPALIRAGASDVVLAVLGDDVVATKVWRLLRRRR